MTDQEKFQHDVTTAQRAQELSTMSPTERLMVGVGMLILNGRTDKYTLEPQERATFEALMAVAKPSFSW